MLSPSGTSGIKDSSARGIVVDLTGREKNIPSIRQMTEALDYLIFNPKALTAMEYNSSALGHEMSWYKTTFDFVRYAQRLTSEKHQPSRRDVVLKREK